MPDPYIVWPMQLANMRLAQTYCSVVYVGQCVTRSKFITQFLEQIGGSAYNAPWLAHEAVLTSQLMMFIVINLSLWLNSKI